jgi:hypothetical protein
MDWMTRVQLPAGVRLFLFFTMFRPALGPTQPHIKRVLGNLSSGVKGMECETDHSPPSIVTVKNIWSYTPLLHTPSLYGT